MKSTSLDSPDIGARARELADERLRNITSCTCSRPDDGGPIDSTRCLVHREMAQTAQTAGREDVLCWAEPLTDAEIDAIRDEYRRALDGRCLKWFAPLGRVIP